MVHYMANHMQGQTKIIPFCERGWAGDAKKTLSWIVIQAWSVALCTAVSYNHINQHTIIPVSTILSLICDITYLLTYCFLLLPFILFIYSEDSVWIVHCEREFWLLDRIFFFFRDK